MAERLKRKPAWTGRSFKSLFKAQEKSDTVKNNLESSDKRKRDSCMELDASPGCKTSTDYNTCVVCSKRQRLCDGKYIQTSCGPSSLDPFAEVVPVGGWHCFQCLNNKMQAGACQLSHNVEAIWNARETEVSDAEGLRKEKQYFVKYKGLAHIHNQWIPTSRLPVEADMLIEKFKKEREAVRWNEEWVLPHRLLKKRLLLSAAQENNAPYDTSSCQYEWLVKWRGLDYESVTWELDTFVSLHGANLIEEYQNRHKKALDNFSSVDKDKNGSLVELQKLPAGSPPGLDTSHLETVNKLREFMHKGQSTIVFDDKDRIMMTLLYVLSLSDTCWPFLIVTTSSLLPLWEAGFLRAVPSVDTVVYNGSIHNRQCIRMLEFYDDDGRMMLQVLLSSVEIVVEDFPFLNNIKWKVVIVDECQQPNVSSQFAQIKVLAASVKILLYNGQLKDNVAEYLNLLSLLESTNDSRNIDVLNAESINNLCKLRERLSRYVACEDKSSSSKFVEFWVPSILSNAQLEQYCDTLLSNSLSLCSYSKTDPVGALRNIVLSTRKSCDHPYTVDSSLKRMITKDIPPVHFLDTEIKASGKLQLLEIILSEIKRRQLRVLILFQSVAGSGRDTMGLGDILDDFLRERFGGDTFERIDRGVTSIKLKQKALNNFNEGNGRFMFLLENRACLTSIKLVSVDTIVIFDSDWNPANDVKALNKISITSQFKQIKIFRLYSAFTVEEKVLILAKQGHILESNLDSINRATSNTLLMWGASYLLDRLDEFHSTAEMNVSSEHEISSKVMNEISALLSQNGECDGMDNFSICKIQQRGGIYYSNLKLLGERQIQLSDNEHPQNFWSNLLNRRILKWKFLSGKIQRHRRKGQYLDDIPRSAECGAVEVGKKRKNGETNSSYPIILNSGLERDKTGGAHGIQGDYDLCCSKRPGASATNLLHPSTAPTIVSEKSMLPDAQTNFDLVKPDFLKLCEILKYSDEVKMMAERFLEYVISIYKVNNNCSASTLQAFLIALCWGSASLLKQKVNKKDSLLLAEKHLEFRCNEEEADALYFSIVQILVKTFEENMLSDLSDGGVSGVKNLKEGTLNENVSQLQTVKPELEEMRETLLTDEISQDNERYGLDIENNFELIQRKCKKRIEKVKQKHEEEIRKMNNDWEFKRKEIESWRKVRSVLLAEVFKQPMPIRTDKLKNLDKKYRMELEVHKCQKEISLEQSKAKHLDALSNERSKVEQWLKSASIATKVAGQDELALQQCDVQNELGYSQASQHVSPNVSESHVTPSRYPDDFPSELTTGKMLAVSGCTTDPNQDGRDGLDVLRENPNCKNDAAENMAKSLNPSGLGSQANRLVNVSENDLTPESIIEEVTGQIVEVNPLDDDRVRHLAENQPEIQQQIVEHAEQLPSQVQHLESNVELHPPTDVIETPLQQNKSDLLFTSTLDHQPPKSNTSPLNSEAVPRTELPRQAVISEVDMSVVQGFQDLPLPAEHQVPSQILKPTLFSDPLLEELERISKETEQTIKLHEDAKMRLKSEFEELITQIHKKYEDNCKDLDVVFQQKKKELDNNHNKVLMNGLLADAFRCKCMEPSTYNGMQQGVHHGLVQPLNQVPPSVASTSAAITVKSSAGQPAGCQRNTVLTSQPSSMVHLDNVTTTTCQPAVSQQNTVSLSQHGARLLPVASSSGSQLAVKQHCSTLPMQPGPGNNVISDSFSAGQPAANPQNITPLLHPSLRISPLAVSPSGVQSAAHQRSTPPLQIVQQSAALFSSTPTTPLQNNPISPLTGNLRVGSENRARAPAPHLPPFRFASGAYACDAKSSDQK
ncbi:uncharacterized protein LOC108206162 isoform X1 [Daucus carota subsp. sativus]|uniref:uncharacterized protein LOC108206162 isoform X1 n=1 Tax=Daucus carota subsp. sativus TaxID=79200 RepID=UPI0007EFDFA6|nr:PREDICTED: uncharacterized protein LOC108206162 [Daucus carota subsp. sativus]